MACLSFATLPPEIRVCIAEQLDQDDLLRLGCVNKNNFELLRPQIAGYRFLCALTQRNKTLAMKILQDNLQIDLKVCCRKRMSAIHVASLNGFKDILRILLVDRGHKYLLEAHDDDKNTPLIYASRYSDDETISFLIQQGTNVNARNNLGETALHLASSRGKEMAVNRLLEANATVSLANAAGMTPLWYATTRQYVAIAKRLMLAGAIVPSRNSGGDTELHLAARFDSLELAKLFLDRGANPSAFDIAGWTPLIWSAWNGNIELTSVLILNGADVVATDKDGSSALDFAIRAGHTEVSGLLRSHIGG
jgi:ankyrin repeat protein